MKKCSTCDGRGKTSRGQRFLDCNGKGEYPDEDLISDLNSIDVNEIDESFVDDFSELDSDLEEEP